MNPQEAPQKLKDFQQELNELCAKYQYELGAVLEPIHNPWGAIIGERATIQAFDVSPKDQPQDTPPATPTPPIADQTAPTPLAAPEPPAPPQDAPATPNVPTDVPSTPEDPAKKNEGEAQPNNQSAPAEPANPPSIDATNPQPDPANSTPETPAPDPAS